jgi:hypothetical protein
MEFRSVSLRDCLYHCSVKNFQQNCTCDFAPEKSRLHTFSVMFPEHGLIYANENYILIFTKIGDLSWICCVLNTCRGADLTFFFFLRLIKSRGRPGNGRVVTKNFSKTVCCMLNNLSSCKKFVAN